MPTGMTHAPSDSQSQAKAAADQHAIKVQESNRARLAREERWRRRVTSRDQVESSKFTRSSTHLLAQNNGLLFDQISAK